MKMLKTLVTTLMFVVAVSANAEVYRWTDENGRVHFSDKPVGDKAETVDIKTDPVAPANAISEEERKKRQQQFLRSRDIKRQEDANKQAEAKRDKAKREKACAELKDEYRRISRAGAVYINDKNGNRQFLEKNEREAEERKLQAAIKKYCK